MTSMAARVALIWLAAVPSVSSTESAIGVAAQSMPPASSRAKSQWDGLYTDEQAKRGEMLYVENCSACHGMGLGGGFGPVLAGTNFVAKWRDRPLAELFESMRLTMPPTFPGGFSRQQNADILAFMLQKSKFPAGDTELIGDAELLNQIRLIPAKR